MNTPIFNLNKIFWLPFILIFFPSFCLPFGKNPITYFFISLISIFLCFILFKSNYCIKKTIFCYKKTALKYIVWWFIYTIVSGIIIYALSGIYNSISLLKLVIFSFIIPFFYTLFLIDSRKNLYYLIKIYSVLFLIILILGILSYYSADIGIISSLFSFLVNKRAVMGDTATVDSVYRAFATFAEPGWFAGFLLFNIPIILNICFSKFKIFKNKFWNIFIKKTLFILSIINMFLTKSPINLFTFIIICIFYFTLKEKNLTKKILWESRFLVIFITIISLLFLLYFNEVESIQSNNKVLERVNIVISAIKNRDFEQFIAREPSLATRISSYNAHIQIFKKHPFFGVGLNNQGRHMLSVFSKEDIPITRELLFCYINTDSRSGMHTNGAILYELLSGTGFIGFFLYYLFIFKLYAQLRICSKIYSGIERDYIIGLRRALLILCLYFSFYDMGLSNTYTWFLFGIGISVLCIANKTRLIPQKIEER